MNKQILLLMFAIILIGGISAEVNPCGNSNSFLGTFAVNSTINLKQTCDTCTYVNLSSVTYPDSSSLVLNAEMSKNNVDYNYSFSNATLLGCYYYTVYGNKDTEFKSEDIWFQTTSTGKTITTGSSLLIILGVILFFVLGILLFIGFLKGKGNITIKGTYLVGSFIFFLAGLNLISTILPDALINEKVASFFDTFTGISFILFWFCFGLLAIMWFLTILNTIFYEKNRKAMEKHG